MGFFFSSLNLTKCSLTVKNVTLPSAAHPKPKSYSLKSEFSDFIADVIVKHENVIMVGDFNFRVDDAAISTASDFIRVTESVNFLQHVKDPIHNCGCTLRRLE